jgi:hypothetical protein
VRRRRHVGATGAPDDLRMSLSGGRLNRPGILKCSIVSEVNAITRRHTLPPKHVSGQGVFAESTVRCTRSTGARSPPQIVYGDIAP